MMRTFIILCLLSGVARAQSLTLSPAVVPLGGRPGESTTQHLTLFNGTSQALSFELVAKDVVVRDGARTFVEAGETPASIAASAVFSTRKLSLRAGEERSVDVTLTLPNRVRHRAVIILFRGTTKIAGNATVSLGSLLTFELSSRISIAPGELHATPPTRSVDAAFSLPITNDGSEPAIARAALAIVTPGGMLVGKSVLEPRRLLPGERTVLSTSYPGVIPSGLYRVIATIESSKRSWTRTTELGVP